LNPQRVKISNFQISNPGMKKKKPNQISNHRMPRELINEEQMEAMAENGSLNRHDPWSLW
jgi:hypothetical protein